MRNQRTMAIHHMENMPIRPNPKRCGQSKAFTRHLCQKHDRSKHNTLHTNKYNPRRRQCGERDAHIGPRRKVHTHCHKTCARHGYETHVCGGYETGMKRMYETRLCYKGMKREVFHRYETANRFIGMKPGNFHRGVFAMGLMDAARTRPFSNGKQAA